MPQLVGINKHLATLNGSVARNTKCLDEHGDEIERLKGQLSDHTTNIAVIRAVDGEREKRHDDRDRFQSKEIDEAKAQQKELMARIWHIAGQVSDVAIKVAAAGSIIYLVAEKALK
jgi:hypothetical protein